MHGDAEKIPFKMLQISEKKTNKKINDLFLIIPYYFLLQLDYLWAMVACGRTQDQLDLTEKAHKFLKTSGLKPRSLNF